MNIEPTRFISIFARASLMAALSVATLGCSSSDEDVQPIAPGKPVAKSTRPFNPDLSSRERFGYGPAESSVPERLALPTAQLFAYQVPQGWHELAPTQFRNPNFLIGDAADPAQAYVTVLRGSGGGLTRNFNRWRGEMGLEPLDSNVIITQLEKITVFDEVMPLLELTGTFTGMRGDPTEGSAMLATVYLGGNFALFIKMVGPETIVLSNKDAFLAFCESLAFKAPDTPPAQ